MGNWALGEYVDSSLVLHHFSHTLAWSAPRYFSTAKVKVKIKSHRAKVKVKVKAAEIMRLLTLKSEIEEK